MPDKFRAGFQALVGCEQFARELGLGVLQRRRAADVARMDQYRFLLDQAGQFPEKRREIVDRLFRFGGRGDGFHDALRPCSLSNVS